VIWYWPYELTPRRSLGILGGKVPRRGALIRVDEGFADVHPWPEVGHQPLEDQLELLGRGETTPLTAQSLRMAQLDAQARAAGRSLFDGLRIPDSHFLITGSVRDHDLPAIEQAGFRKVKIKTGGDPSSMPSLGTRMKLRLDFNASLTADSLRRFLEEARQAIVAIDFLEDPTPYDARLWEDLARRYGCRFAADMVNGGRGVAVRVVKPAWRSEQTLLDTTQEIVFTSAMDHPVGQMGAAFIAARTAKKLAGRVVECGLLTHELFETTEFSERIVTKGPRLEPPSGSGIGFDDLLLKLPWKKLG
jgi:O-succinylbenzoate synthase